MRNPLQNSYALTCAPYGFQLTARLWRKEVSGGYFLKKKEWPGRLREEDGEKL